MNTPNKLTSLRMIMVIPFLTFMSISLMNGSPNFKNFNDVGTWSFFIGGLIFLFAMITDWIDGYLARKNNQVTTFGKLFDPLADKIMTTSALIMLSLMQITPFYLVLIFIIRDLLVDGFRNLAASKKINVAASIYGKAKTMVQSIAIVLLFFIYPIWQEHFGSFNYFVGEYSLFIINIPMYIATLLSILSGIIYFNDVKKHIKIN
ncbi:MAG: CDP-diacylglycerol--glycerol-3-phosphate 3-phosphatidyltransferase [Mycoplasmatales bacterium]|nr:CDP-diacylglycerol--glycerol-3-phosphate 3-phosphatidyltransferase [Mycoplasmatales bacterium]